MTKKDDLPAMMFYVGDWLKAPDIQCLSYELKGIWFEMLCFMWESNERGYLKYTTEELARLLRLPEDLLKQKLEQLSKRGIYSVRESDGAIYSRRMVKDQSIREKRKKAGSLGGKKTFANKFAQAKIVANAEDEVANEDININKEEDTDVRNLFVKRWSRSYKNISEMQGAEKLVCDYGYEKVDNAFRIAGERDKTTIPYVRGILSKEAKDNEPKKRFGNSEVMNKYFGGNNGN